MYIFQMIDGLSVGGAEHLQITFAKEAKRRNFKLTVISLEAEDDSQYLSELRSLGVPVYFFPTKRIFDIKNIYRIMRFFLKERPDVVHTHLTYANIIGSITARLTRIPVVATLHSTGIDERLRASRTERVEKIALRYFINKIIACGPAVARYFNQENQNVPTIMIPNAVEDFPEITNLEYENLKKQIVGDLNRVLIISVGRLEKHKGFIDLLKAFSILHQSHPSAFLALVGGGSIKDDLELMVSEYGLSDHVKLLGWRTDVKSLLFVSDLYVLASHWEGLPIAILEAMAAGLPVLATNVGDNAWAIDAAGEVVPPHKPEILSDAMAKLLDDPVRCKELGKKARIRFEENFKSSIWFDNIIAVYQSLLH